MKSGQEYQFFANQLCLWYYLFTSDNKSLETLSFSISLMLLKCGLSMTLLVRNYFEISGDNTLYLH